jgi:hypothetical protein
MHEKSTKMHFDRRRGGRFKNVFGSKGAQLNHQEFNKFFQGLDLKKHRLGLFSAERALIKPLLGRQP